MAFSTTGAAGLPTGADMAGLAREVERMVASNHIRIVRDDDTGTRYLFVNGLIAETLDPVNRVLPQYIDQRVTVLTAESFIDYAREFAPPDTEGATPRGRMFIDVTDPTLTYVFDYHSLGMPGHNAHVLSWKMRTSLNYQRWAGIDGRLLTQAEFVEFLEENEVDVREPAGAALREMLMAVEGSRQVSFKNSKRLSNGDVEIAWEEQTEAKTKGGDVLPGSFTLGLPVFFGDREATPFKAFLRYSVEAGKLRFKVVLNRRQEIFETAVLVAAHRVAAELGQTALVGGPR